MQRKNAGTSADVRTVRKTTTMAYSGLLLGVVGATLDFWSGYSLAPMTSGGMAADTALSVSLYLLGFGVLGTGLLLALPSMRDRMRRLGLLMEVFGVLMALASFWVPGMDVGVSYAMLIVGGLMILNGARMQRGGMGAKQATESRKGA